MLLVRGSIRKNPSATLAKDKTKVEYISGRQLLPYELAFGVELCPNPHSKKSNGVCSAHKDQNALIERFS